MRKPYLNTLEALDLLREDFDVFMTYEALKKHIKRGNLVTRQFKTGGTHLITRGALTEFIKIYNERQQ